MLPLGCMVCFLWGAWCVSFGVHGSEQMATQFNERGGSAAAILLHHVRMIRGQEGRGKSSCNNKVG